MEYPTREERKYLLENKICYKHFDRLDEEFKTDGYITVAMVRYDGVNFYGVSCCHPRDAELFNKREGRIRAVKRLSFELQNLYDLFSGTVSSIPGEKRRNALEMCLLDFLNKTLRYPKEFPGWLKRWAKWENHWIEYANALLNDLDLNTDGSVEIEAELPPQQFPIATFTF